MKKGHIWNVKTCTKTFNISVHAWCNNYSPYFINTSVIDEGNFWIQNL